MKSPSPSGLNYLEKGQGSPTMVFLHFFGGSSNSWSEIMERLSARHRCIALDLRGFGASEAPDQPYRVQDHVHDVVATLAAFQLKQWILVGHSMGGKIAMSLAARRPQGLVGLILLATSPPSPEPRSDRDRSALLDAYGHRPAIEQLIHKIAVQPLSRFLFDQVVADHLRTNAVAWKAWIEIGSQEDISPAIALVEVPVKVFSGAQDPVFSIRFLQTELNKYFPNAVYTAIPGVGHLLPLEAPGCLDDL